MCQSHWSAQYRSRSPGQVHREEVLGLVVEGLTVEDIWKGDVKGVKVNETQNIGQGHPVKVPAESVH